MYMVSFLYRFYLHNVTFGSLLIPIKEEPLVKKSIFSTMIILLLLFLFTDGFPEGEILQDGDWEYTVTNSEATIVKYNGNAERITFPESVDGYPVRVIGNGKNAVVYASNTNATTVTGTQYITVPYGVTRIADKAFTGQAIRSISLPSSLQSIGSEAFYNTWITAVTIPGSVDIIENYAFYSNSKLKTITIQNGVREIGTYAFASCWDYFTDGNGRITLSLPETSLRTIGDNAFSGSWLTSFVFPEGLTSVGKSIISHNEKMSSVTLPSDWTSIPDGLFKDYTGSGTLTIPEGITSIGAEAFSCSSYTPKYRIVLPSGLVSIGDKAFFNTKKLFTGNYTVDSTVTTIGTQAFYNCGIETLTLPDEVAIGTQITDVIVKARLSSSAGSALISQETYSLIDLDNPDYQIKVRDGKAIIMRYAGTAETVSIPASFGDVPTEEISSYSYKVTKEDEDGDPYTVTYTAGAFQGNNTVKSIILPNTLLTINTKAFQNCTALETISLPTGLKSIGDYAFRSCGQLQEIQLPYGLETIGTNVFSGCSSLTALEIPGSWTEVPAGFFSGLTGLTSITIPNSITTIGANAFMGCSGLQQITLPAGLTSLGAAAFRGCSVLKSVNLPTGLTSLENQTFNICPALESISLPTGLTEIKAEAFKGCTGLKAINLSNVITLGENVFSDCVALDTVTLSSKSGFTQIPAGAFMNCTGLANIEIPSSVTVIGDNAFKGCTGLTSLTLTQALTTIGASAFENCSGITTLTQKSITKITSIGEKAFAGCDSIKNMVVPMSLSSLGANAFPAGILLHVDFSSNSYGKIKNYGISYLAYSGTTEMTVTEYKGTLDTVTVPEIFYGVRPVIKIGSSAFNAANVKKIVLPSTITHLYYRAFAGSSVEEIDFSGAQITTVGDSCFQYCTGLKSLNLPDSVTYLGEDAFRGMTRLETIHLPNNDKITTLGNAPFDGCTSLQTLTLPDYLVADSDLFTVDIGHSARLFANLGTTTTASLCAKNIEFSSSLTPDWLFRLQNEGTSMMLMTYYGEGSENMEIPAAIEEIPVISLSSCFKDSHPEILQVTIPSSVTNIYENVFSGCSNLASVFLGDNLKTVIGNAFNANTMVYYKAGTSTDTALKYESLNAIGYSVDQGAATVIKGTVRSASLAIPSQIAGIPVTSIADDAFLNQTALKSLTIPDSVTSIGQNAFKGCSGLEQINFGSGLVTIGFNAFENCKNLTGTILLPDSLRNLNNDAFKNSGKADTIIRLNDSLTNVRSSAFNDYNGKIQCTVASSAFWGIAKTAENSLSGLEFTDPINAPDWVLTVTNLSKKTMKAVSYLGGTAYNNTISIPGRINTWAVSELADELLIQACPGVLILNEGLESIGNDFMYATNLTELTFPSTLKTIGNYAFFGSTGSASKLTTVTLNSGLVSIGEHAFGGHKNLKSIELPASLKVLGEYAFRDGGISTLTLPDNMTNPGYRPMGVTNSYGIITDRGTIFCKADSATARLVSGEYYDPRNPDWSLINMTGGLRISLWKYSSGDELTVPAMFYGQNVVSLGSMSAADYKKIILPEGLASISGSFNSNVEEVIIPDSVTSIGSGLFESLRHMEEIILPDNIQLYDTASSPLFHENTRVIARVNTTTAKNLKASGFQDPMYPGVNYKYVNGVLHLTGLDESTALARVSRFTEVIDEGALDSAAQVVFENAPVITVQPTNILANPGSTVEFSAQATNTVKTIWQESLNGGITWLDIDEADSSGLSVSVTAENSNRLWRMAAYGPLSEYGNITYSKAVGILPKLDNIEHPENVSAEPGEYVTFIAGADNAGSCQWEMSRDGGNTWSELSGEEYPELEIMCEDAEIYFRCRFTGISGDTETTEAAWLRPAYHLIKAPESKTGAINENVILSIKATGVRSITWQCSVDNGQWATVGSGDQLSVTVTDNMRSHEYRYRCVLSPYNSSETVETAAVVITVKAGIAEQPTDQHGIIGNEVTFRIETTDAETWQWQQSTDNGITWYDLTGENSPALTLTTSEEMADYVYRCQITGSGDDTVNSDSVRVLIQANALNTLQDQAAFIGDTVSLHAEASGTKAFQWFSCAEDGSNETPCEGESAGTDTLTFLLTEESAERLYFCQLTGLDGQTTRPVSLRARVLSKARITQEPSDVTTEPGTSAEFHLATTGAKTILWESSEDGINWTAVPDSTDICTVTVTEEAAQISYRCAVTGSDGETVYSKIVRVKPPAVITQQPSPVNSSVGLTSGFTVQAYCAVSYQWEISQDGDVWAELTDTSSTSPTLSIKITTDNLEAFFRCKVTGYDSQAVYSDPVQIIASAYITNQPQSATVGLYDIAEIRVEAKGAASYRWQITDESGSTWIDFTGAGADTPAITLLGRESLFGRSFHCIITGKDGKTKTSRAATLTRGNSENTRILHIPVLTESIEDEAFAGIDAEVAVFTDHCQTFGKSIFTGSSMRFVYMPDGNVTIDPDAFAGCSVTLIVFSGSQAENFAQQHHLPYEAP